MSKSFNIGIDASRCRSGGARVHLIGILNNFNPISYNIDFVHVWSYAQLLNSIPDFPWLIKHRVEAANSSLLCQLFWQRFKLALELRREKCNILFSADASTLCNFRPQIVLSQDLLSYEPGITKLFGWGKERLRLIAIRLIQNRSFRTAEAVIFLTRYAGKVIQASCGKLKNIAYIPHGADDRFMKINSRELQYSIDTKTINCVYVSNTAPYKNQCEVVIAVDYLRQSGADVSLTLVGGGSGRTHSKLLSQIKKSDPNSVFIKQKDFISHDELLACLSEADIFIFASTCEAFGITLLEAMSIGLPIACSNRSCLPELLEDAGIYFSPNDPSSIAHALQTLVEDRSLRHALSIKSKNVARKYSWHRCANETWSYINKILNELYG